MPRGRIKVAVCVCTYRRLDGLRSLLLGIAQLRFERIAEPDIEIIVVENDQTGSARPICESLRGILRWPLRYEIEANPGISNARNRCLRIAADDSNLTAFLDDDEHRHRCGWKHCFSRTRDTAPMLSRDPSWVFTSSVLRDS